jgi:hypothetical protein
MIRTRLAPNLDISKPCVRRNCHAITRLLRVTHGFGDAGSRGCGPPIGIPLRTQAFSSCPCSGLTPDHDAVPPQPSVAVAVVLRSSTGEAPRCQAGHGLSPPVATGPKPAGAATRRGRRPLATCLRRIRALSHLGRGRHSGSDYGKGGDGGGASQPGAPSSVPSPQADAGRCERLQYWCPVWPHAVQPVGRYWDPKTLACDCSACLLISRSRYAAKSAA